MRRKRWVVYKAGPSNLALFFLGAAIVSWLVFLVATGFPLYAWVYYRVKPDTSIKLSGLLAETAKTALQTAGGTVPSEERVRLSRKVLPPYDESLFDGRWLIIPKISVDTPIREASYDNYEEVLRKGVWRVPDFGTPMERGKPVILAAHRFGYLEWSNKYRRQNSFFNLPKLEAGDEIEIVWDKRKFKYRVVKVEEGEKIGDYGVDLILYTCKFLVGPMRYFVYAKRM